MPKYRYRPDDNKTPVSHPTIGFLTWDGVYEHPDCKGNPEFEEIHDKKILNDDDAAEVVSPPEIEAPAPVVPAPVTRPSGLSPADAGKPGGSKS